MKTTKSFSIRTDILTQLQVYPDVNVSELINDFLLEWLKAHPNKKSLELKMKALDNEKEVIKTQYQIIQDREFKEKAQKEAEEQKRHETMAKILRQKKEKMSELYKKLRSVNTLDEINKILDDFLIVNPEFREEIDGKDELSGLRNACKRRFNAGDWKEVRWE